MVQVLAQESTEEKIFSAGLVLIVIFLKKSINSDHSILLPMKYMALTALSERETRRSPNGLGT
jgi:hypothetical protein